MYDISPPGFVWELCSLSRTRKPMRNLRRVPVWSIDAARTQSVLFERHLNDPIVRSWHRNRKRCNITSGSYAIWVRIYVYLIVSINYIVVSTIEIRIIFEKEFGGKYVCVRELSFESARAIFQSKKQCIFSARVEFLEFTLTIEHPERHSTTEQTYCNTSKSWRRVPQAGSISSAIKQSNSEHKETSALSKGSSSISYQEMGKGRRASLRRRESWERCFWLISVNSSDRFSRFTFS